VPHLPCDAALLTQECNLLARLTFMNLDAQIPLTPLPLYKMHIFDAHHALATEWRAHRKLTSNSASEEISPLLRVKIPAAQQRTVIGHGFYHGSSVLERVFLK